MDKPLIGVIAASSTENYMESIGIIKSYRHCCPSVYKLEAEGSSFFFVISDSVKSVCNYQFSPSCSQFTSASIKQLFKSASFSKSRSISWTVFINPSMLEYLT